MAIQRGNYNVVNPEVLHSEIFAKIETVSYQAAAPRSINVVPWRIAAANTQ
jgi:hypothetical protein